jgi:7-dehydrocholesterol reductase
MPIARPFPGTTAPSLSAAEPEASRASGASGTPADGAAGAGADHPGPAAFAGSPRRRAPISTGVRGAVSHVLIPLLLMTTLPTLTILLWIIVRHFDGSVLAFPAAASVERVIQLWPWPSTTAVLIVAAWVALQTFLLVALPGRRHVGPVTPAGDRVSYRLNGIAAFLTTLVCFYLAAWQLRWFPPTIVYDRFGEILMTSTLVAVLCSVLLYVKGSRAPSTRDFGPSGSAVWDFYWGMELHPRIRGIDVKQLVICRLAMMGWAVVVLSCLARQAEAHGSVSNAMAIAAGLQLLYIFKFFWWEGGYFGTLDVIHYRLGFRNVWGVLAWLPMVYPLAVLCLADHPRDLSVPVAAASIALGLAGIWANYNADAQRQRVRAGAGETTVWGRRPALLEAAYTGADNVRRDTLLLASGWWGLARHFHYVPEMVIAVSWTLPAGLDRILPWFYVVYLGMLLVHRAAYDDRRCLEKYGDAWRAYCARVRYRMIPFLY